MIDLTEMRRVAAEIPTAWNVRFQADNPIVHLNCQPLCLGEFVTLIEPEGSSLPFQVTSVRSDSGQSLIASEPGGECDSQSFGQT